MTSIEDSVSTVPRQALPLCIMLPMGLWFELPDTWANRRGAMILLRGLRQRDGRPLVTYEHLAQELGYADRRNVHNFWAEFEAVDRTWPPSCNAARKSMPRWWSVASRYGRLTLCGRVPKSTPSSNGAGPSTAST